ncbi:MAG TPA: hypothetical protein VGG09_04220 [Acidimicrobiales bacterium]
MPRARSSLVEAIALELANGNNVRSGSGASPRTHRRSRRSVRWSIGITTVAAASIVIALLVVPSARRPSAPAAAAEIARLADAVPPVPPLTAGEWYQYQLQGELSANVTTGSGTSATSATADIPIAIGEWSNATGAVCTSQQFGTAAFPSSANAQAWQKMGLVATPANQPAIGCSAGLEATAVARGTPVGPINVANITHDPSTLAAQLANGATGINEIDNYATGEPARVVGFLRLTDLLVGPLEGQWSGFGQEMLNTLSLLPGISALGTMTTHAGASGLAFSMPKQVTLNPNNGAETYAFTPPTVILDPQNGSLLEARNLDFSILQSAAEDFVGGPSALVYTQGVGYGLTAQWVDPVSGLQVIGASLVPSWITTYHVIEAVTAPSATASQLEGLINPFLGNGNSAFSNDDVPGAGQSTYDITIMGTATTAQNFANTLIASGLFTSVSVKL